MSPPARANHGADNFTWVLHDIVQFIGNGR